MVRHGTGGKFLCSRSGGKKWLLYTPSMDLVSGSICNGMICLPKYPPSHGPAKSFLREALNFLWPTSALDRIFCFQ
jgi:hypothetical protein